MTAAAPDHCAGCGCGLTAETTASTYTARGITLAWCRSCTHDNRQQTLELADRVPGPEIPVGSPKPTEGKPPHVERVADNIALRRETGVQDD